MISKLSFVSNSKSRNSSLTERKDNYEFQKSKRDHPVISPNLSRNYSGIANESFVSDD